MTETADILIRSAGHVARERSRLQADGRWASLEREVCDLVQTSNQPDGEPGVRIVLDYLLVIGSLTNGD